MSVASAQKMKSGIKEFPMKFQDTVAIVTGAGSGIGRRSPSVSSRKGLG